MAEVSLKCGDCGSLFRTVGEAEEHARFSKHTNYVESREPVLNLVCSSCGKSCWSLTESDLHTRRTGHNEFVYKTEEATATRSSETPKVEDDVIMDEADDERISSQEGNASLDDAVMWGIKHVNDPDIEEMPSVPVSPKKPEASKPKLKIKQKQQDAKVPVSPKKPEASKPKLKIKLKQQDAKGAGS